MAKFRFLLEARGRAGYNPRREKDFGCFPGSIYLIV
jgi:hypothetical protein